MKAHLNVPLQPLCHLCGNPIAARGERWERYSQDPSDTRRIHSSCVAQLTRDVFKLMAKVPEVERGND